MSGKHPFASQQSLAPQVRADLWVGVESDQAWYHGRAAIAISQPRRVVASWMTLHRC